MSRVRIDGTALQVSRWSFGTASLHHVFWARQRQRVLAAAADVGFSHFDTAPLYGNGLAEIDLGKFLRNRRASFTVATKVGLYPAGESVSSASALWLQRGARRLLRKHAVARVDGSVRTAEQSLDASLKRLRIDYVDILLLHEPDPALMAADEFARWLEREVARGRIRNWGLAGARVATLDWVAKAHALTRILQVKDSVDAREADALRALGRKLQFTYGYLSSLQREGLPIDAAALRRILARNPDGSIIISSRRPKRLAEFAAAAETESCK